MVSGIRKRERAGIAAEDLFVAGDNPHHLAVADDATNRWVGL